MTARTPAACRLIGRILGRLHMMMLMMAVVIAPLILMVIPPMILVMVILLVMVIASDCHPLLMVMVILVIVLLLFLRGGRSCAAPCRSLFSTSGPLGEAGRFLLLGLRRRFFAARAVVKMVNDLRSPLVFSRRIALVVDNLLKLNMVTCPYIVCIANKVEVFIKRFNTTQYYDDVAYHHLP